MEVYHEKRMRTLICLVLVVLLTASMAVPAMAETASGSNLTCSYPYAWTVEQTDVRGRAYIYTTAAPTHLTAQVQIETYYDLTGTRFGHEPISVTGYSAAIAIDDNIIEKINDVPVRAIVTGAKASFKVGQTQVLKEQLVGTWYNVLQN